MTDSLSELRKLLEEQEEHLGSDSPKVANTLTALADLLCMQDRAVDAEPLYWRVLEIRHQNGGQKSLDVAAVLQDLSMLYERQESWQDAERMLRWCCEIKRELLGPQAPEYIASLSRLGRVLDVQGKQEDVSLEAITPSEVLVFTRPGIERYPWTEHCASAREMLKRGAVEEAARYLACLADTADCFAADSVHQARILNLRCRALGKLNRYAEARGFCEQALALFERIFGTNHLETMECLVNMANLHIAQNEVEEARFLYQWAHNIAITLEGEGCSKARKLEQKIASLPEHTIKDEPIDGSFLLEIQNEVLFSTGEYLKPSPDQLLALNPMEQAELAEFSATIELAEQQQIAARSAFLPNSSADSSLPSPSMQSLFDSNKPDDHSTALHQPEEPEPNLTEGGWGRPEPLATSIRDSGEQSDRADQFFAQLEALAKYEKRLESENETEPTEVEAPTSTSSSAAKPAQAKPDPVKSAGMISEFGKAFGLEPSNEPPREELPKPNTPHAIEEFDSNVSVFLWEKYVKSGERALSQRDYVEAERMFSVALEKAQGFNDERLWSTLCSLGLAHQHLKKFVRAESCYKQAQTLCEKRLGPEHAANIDYWKHLAGLYVEQRNFMLAEQCYKRMLHLMTKSGSPESELKSLRSQIEELQSELPSH